MKKVNSGLTSDQKKYVADTMQLIITVCNAYRSGLHDTDVIHIVSENYVKSMGSPQNEFQTYMYSQAGILNPEGIVIQLCAPWPQVHDLQPPVRGELCPSFRSGQIRLQT